MEQFLADIQEALKKAGVKRVTELRSYYILDGKVCLPEDYDADTQDFKPGAGPPSWAGGTVPTRTLAAAKTEEDQVEEAPRARKTRSDKGRSRGPRARPTAAKQRAVIEAADDLAEAIKGSGSE